MRKTFPVLAVLMALSSLPAMAHVHLVSSDPADKSVVASPSQIVMRFNGALIARGAGIKLVDSRGGTVAATMVPGASAGELTVKPDRVLAPGVYRATWTAAGEDDGHRMSGNISFTVK